MSIRISNAAINQTKVTPNNRVVAFKSNSLPQDKVEISAKKKELSTGAKVGIGLSIAAVLGLGIYKRKSLKNLWEKIFGGKSNKGVNKGVDKGVNNRVKDEAKDGVSNNAKTQIANTIHPVADFKNLDEAKAWFENLGIKPEFRNLSDNDLVYVNKIANDFNELERLGVAVSKPDSLIISDWRKVNELSGLYTERNIPHDIDVLRECTDYWGRAQVGTDGKIHVFLNTNNLSTVADKKIVQHEMGHHCRILKDSVLNKINNLENLGSKKLEILGYNTTLAHKDIFGRTREYCLKTDGVEFASALNKNGVYAAGSPVLSGKGITDLFNREVQKSYGYNSYKADEFCADIFRGLTTGRTYSDEVMIAYDFIDGGRVPNLVIKGKSYDDYIKSLYDNPELVQKLKDMIQLKYVADVVGEERVILKDVSKETQAMLMRN